MTHVPEQPDGEPRPRRKLAEDLAGLYRVPAVPPAVDMAVLASAKLRMRAGRRQRVLWRWAGTAAAVSAVAAILLVAVYVRPGVMSRERPVQLASRAAPAGKVTILDAFQLARRLEAGGVSDLRWDANHDGVVDRKDVDSMAMAAVRLKGEAVQ